MYCTFAHSLLCSVMIFSAIFYFCSLKTTFRAAVCQMEFFLSTHFPLQKEKKKKSSLHPTWKSFINFFSSSLSTEVCESHRNHQTLVESICSKYYAAKLSTFNLNIRACQVLINRKYSYYIQIQNLFYETGLNQSQFF